jgi:hypothetical protein
MMKPQARCAISKFFMVGIYRMDLTTRVACRVSFFNTDQAAPRHFAAAAWQVIICLHTPQHVQQHEVFMSNPIIQRDTGAWQMQVWISFGLAVFLCGTGLSWLPGQDLDRAFMVMGYIFCLSTAFFLAKFVRDNQYKQNDTPMWKMVVYTAFFVAMTLTAWGLWRMNVNDTYKAFLLVSWLYLITTTFTLAKTLRDKHEADLAEARMQARSEVRREMEAK